MKTRTTPFPSAPRTAMTYLAVMAAVVVTGCGTGSEEQTGLDTRDPAGAVTNAEELRSILVDEGFSCAEGEKEGAEGRTLSQCESGILLAVFDDAEVAASVAESYLNSDKHVLREGTWMVVDFQEESRLAQYQEALGGEIVEE